jgi:hypothetical protein
MLALVLCATVLTTGCASAGARSALAGPQAPVPNQRATMAEYVQQLPVGSRVRVERVEGGAIRGTLMKATGDAIVVQKNTRLPEPPIQIALSDVTRVTVEGGGSSTAKAIGIGIAAGVGGVLAFFAILAAVIGD